MKSLHRVVAQPMANARLNELIIEHSHGLGFGGEVLKRNAVLTMTRGVGRFAAIDRDILEKHGSRVLSIEINRVWAVGIIGPDLNVSNTSRVILHRCKGNRVRVPYSDVETQVVYILAEIAVPGHALRAEKLGRRSGVESRRIRQETDVGFLRSGAPECPRVPIDSQRLTSRVTSGRDIKIERIRAAICSGAGAYPILREQ